MSVAVVSAPRGLVSCIISKIDEVVARGYRIHKITLEILGKPFVQEGEELRCYQIFRRKIETEFLDPFDKNFYTSSVARVFQEFTQNLQNNAFAELTCDVAIESTCDVDAWTKKVQW